MKNILIVLGFLLAFVAGYFVSQKYDFKIENKKQEQSLSPTVKPTESKQVVDNNKEENSEEDIKQAILDKHGWTKEKVNITISKSNEIFARGGIKEVEAVSGGMFLAKKINGKWEIVFEGNGVPDCNLLKTTYQFPADFLVGICD